MLLGIERAVVEDVWVEREAIVVSVRPKSREQHRCGVCGRRCPREDSGEGRRRWRALDLGTTFAFLEAPSLSTSGETLTIGESMNLGGENGERRDVGDEYEWSCG
jgi:transposase